MWVGLIQSAEGLKGKEERSPEEEGTLASRLTLDSRFQHQPLFKFPACQLVL